MPRPRRPRAGGRGSCAPAAARSRAGRRSSSATISPSTSASPRRTSRQAGELGIRRRHVVAVAAHEADAAAVDAGEHADAVPLPLERPVRRARPAQRARRGEHRAHEDRLDLVRAALRIVGLVELGGRVRAARAPRRSRVSASRSRSRHPSSSRPTSRSRARLRRRAPVARPLVLHAMQQPVALLARRRSVRMSASRTRRPAVRRAAPCRVDDHLVVAPLLELVRAGVPDASSCPRRTRPWGWCPRTRRTPSGGPRSARRGGSARRRSGTPLGTAQLTSTPSCSRRKS